MLHEARERLDVDGVADDPERESLRSDRPRPAEATPAWRGGAPARPVGGRRRLRARRRGDGTRLRHRRQPRVRRQRAAHFVHDVRPDEAVVVDGLDDDS